MLVLLKIQLMPLEQNIIKIIKSMKTYQFIVDAGVLVYDVKAKGEDEARKKLAEDGGVNIEYSSWSYPEPKAYLNAELVDVYTEEE